MQTKIPQIKKAEELNKSKSYQALPIYKVQQKIMRKVQNENTQIVNHRMTRKTGFENKINPFSVEDWTEVETSPVEEVLNYQPIQKEIVSDCYTTPLSENKIQEPCIMKSKSQRRLDYSTSKQSPAPNNRYQEDINAEYPIIDLNYHFESFKNEQNMVSSPKYRFENNWTKESIFEAKHEANFRNSEASRNSQERKQKIDDKRQEVLKRKEILEKK